MRSSLLSLLPPLECLRFFEAAARQRSFARAARELKVTPAAVAYRVKLLETHLGHTLFDRDRRSVMPNRRGQAFFGDVQRILTDIRDSLDRYHSSPQRRHLKIVAVESVADRWLMPKIESFNEARPDIAIELETDHLGVDPNGSDFDVWITFDGGATAPSAERTLWEALFEDKLLPVCSPALFEIHGRPRNLVDLHDWPLLYHLGWPSDWAQWFASQGSPPPDLSRASGFRLCSMVLRATLKGMGAAVGRPKVIVPELENGTLVPVLDQRNDVCTTCYLMTTADARRKPEVRAFRKWILEGAQVPA